ncbi:MAG TPA: UDP-N-acetylmuramate dehydrogenase [Propionibacteriaceae bacterium]|nr:UDP-N-acetylmuramate dehydrogenase [Propionibacteriaceae bacterium]
MPPEQKLISAYASRTVIMKPEADMRPEPVLRHVQSRKMRPEPVTGRELLANHTTLRVGGPARQMMIVQTEAELIDAVRDLDAVREPLLILGGGSNLLVSDAGFDGTVIKVATRGIAEDTEACSGAVITVAAGEPWDPLVSYTIERGWSGLETMSGIPGLVGATPIQNVGAYGADVSELISTVVTLDRSTGHRKTFFPVECGFGYRTSRFKTDPGRFLVLSVTFQLRLGTMAQPIRYPELARSLEIEVGQRAPTAEVRQAVLGLRTAKGMVLAEHDHDTWSAGSFFTNPIISAAEALALPPDAPRFGQADGMVKTSAAWLIEQTGFAKGYGHGAARISSKHTLALTNRGGATAAQLLNLAREIRAGVVAKFDIELVPEPVLLECEL